MPERPQIETTCVVCGKSFSAARSKVLRGERKCCSTSCRGKLGRNSQPKHNNQRRTHGDCVNGKLPRLYRTWSGIKARCHSPASTSYPEYGARGITMCDEWRASYATFRDWAITNGYADSLQIDRINNDLGYCPENCRWVTPKQNSANRRRSVILITGETVPEAAKRLGMSRSGIGDRIRQMKLPPEQVAFMPKLKGGQVHKTFYQIEYSGRWQEKGEK